MTFEEWAVFMTIWIAASVPLGPNALNCISTSAAHGLKTGLWSVLGVVLAATIHMTVALTGLATFMKAHPVVFEVIRWMGVCYLIWMGLSLLRSKGKVQLNVPTRSETPQRLVFKAIVISLTNPKSIFVWLAIFSQFIEPARALSEQLLILAPSALAVTLAVYLGYSVLGLSVQQVFSGRRKLWIDRVAGSTYVAFGVGLATADLRRV